MKGTNKLKEHTRNLNWYVSTHTKAFFIQKRINVWEKTGKMVCTYIYSLLIEKDPCECWNISVKFVCALFIYLYLSSRELFIFSVSFSSFYSYFCVICTSVRFPSIWSQIFIQLVYEWGYLNLSISTVKASCIFDMHAICWLQVELHCINSPHFYLMIRL